MTFWNFYALYAWCNLLKNLVIYIVRRLYKNIFLQIPDRQKNVGFYLYHPMIFLPEPFILVFSSCHLELSSFNIVLVFNQLNYVVSRWIFFMSSQVTSKFLGSQYIFTEKLSDFQSTTCELRRWDTIDCLLITHPFSEYCSSVVSTTKRWLIFYQINSSN